MTWDSSGPRPTGYLEIKTFIGTLSLVLHQLMDWGSNQMKTLLVVEVQDEMLSTFLETWDDKREH